MTPWPLVMLIFSVSVLGYGIINTIKSWRGYSKELRKKIVGGLFFMAAFFSMVIVRTHYTWDMPGSADTLSGRVIPVHVDFGKIVYVTLIEQKTLYATYSILALAGVLLLAVFAYFLYKNW